MNSEYLLLTGALSVFDDFSQSDCDNYIIKHDIENPKFELLREKYHVSEIAGNGDDFSKAIKLMKWVHDNVQHCGGGGEVEVSKDAVSILSYSFGKGQMPGIFCYHIAIVFTECCLAAGLTARTIHCKPYSPNDVDTHVVSMVYITNTNKWVLFDPNNNAYFTDKNGNALSPTDARRLMGRDEICVCGSPKDNPCGYKQYMAKNLFYIKFWAVNTFGTDSAENQQVYFLAPLGFNIRKREIAYCEYAISINPEEYRKNWENYLNELKGQKFVNVSEEQFLRK